jgi:group I intron endonuclease
MVKHENEHLINAWHKYGEENFDYKVLEYFETVDEVLIKERELYWMDFYQSINRDKGYNLRRDSSTKMILHSETVEKYKKRTGSKNPNFGNKWSEEKKLYMSNLKKSQYQSGEIKPNMEGIRKGVQIFQKKLTDPEYKKRFAEKVSVSKTKYKIEQYSKNGEYIKTWNCVNEILQHNPDYKWQQIYSVCSGNKPSIYGYVWKKVLNNDIVQL